MPSAIAKIGDRVIAETNDAMFVEGNYYFPADSVDMSLMSKTDHHTICHWKGGADYYTINVNGEEFENAAWTYHEPTSNQAKPLKDMVAFYSNIVSVESK